MARFSRSPSPRDRDDGYVKRRRDDRYEGQARRRGSRSRSRDVGPCYQHLTTEYYNVNYD